MRIRKLIWILAGCCLLSGCRSGNANLNEKNVSDTEVTEESAESIEGEVEAKKNNGPALIGEGEDDDAETDDDGFEFI